IKAATERLRAISCTYAYNPNNYK
ncbi:hypothetical protein VWM73_10875, partial [Campylobacter coli]